MAARTMEKIPMAIMISTRVKAERLGKVRNAECGVRSREPRFQSLERADEDGLADGSERDGSEVCTT